MAKRHPKKRGRKPKKKRIFGIVVPKPQKPRKPREPETKNTRVKLGLDPIEKEINILSLLYRPKMVKKMTERYDTQGLKTLAEKNAATRLSLIKKALPAKLINEALYSFGGQKNQAGSMVKNMKITGDAVKGIQRLCLEFVRKVCDESQYIAMRRSRSRSGVGKVGVEDVTRGLKTMFPSIFPFESEITTNKYYNVLGDVFQHSIPKRENRDREGRRSMQAFFEREARRVNQS